MSPLVIELRPSKKVSLSRDFDSTGRGRKGGRTVVNSKGKGKSTNNRNPAAATEGGLQLIVHTASDPHLPVVTMKMCLSHVIHSPECEKILEREREKREKLQQESLPPIKDDIKVNSQDGAGVGSTSSSDSGGGKNTFGDGGDTPPIDEKIDHGEEKEL